jgi:hypothetical protein
MRQLTGFKIGIAWQGNRKYSLDHQRSVGLAEFAPLAELRGVHLVSLQKGPGSEQLGAFAGRWPATDLGVRLDETTGAFMDTAAVMKHLDLIVTSDTSIPHLAGALGVPVWVVLPCLPDWRWLLNREDSPWYPTMRLFRQERAGDWGSVFRRIAEEVSRLMNNQACPKPVLVEVSLGELLDKITILQIKRERISDPSKRANVQRELETLEAARGELGPPPPELARLSDELKHVNEALWDIEDAIRLCERNQDFGPRFIELARAVYHQNDHRGHLKRQVNDLLGSRLREEKAYTSYGK